MSTPTIWQSPINGAQAALAAKYTVGLGSMVITKGYGDVIRQKLLDLGLPSISPSAPLAYTITSKTQPSTLATYEAIYQATGLTDDTLSGVSTIEGSIDQAFSIGSKFAVNLTAGQIALIQTAINAVETGKAPLIAPTFTGQVSVQAPTASTLLQRWLDSNGSMVATIDNAGSNLGTAELTILGIANAGIQDLGGQVVNVKNPAYGCTGNGTTDDAPALRLAITKAAAIGGTVFFPNGTFLLKSQITIPSNVTFQGAGPGSVIQGDGTFQVLFDVTAVSNVQFVSLKLNGGASVGIYIDTSSHISVTNCEIDNFTRVRDTLYTSGILLNAASNVLIRGNKFSGCGYNAGPGTAANGTIVFKDNATTDCTNVTVSENAIFNAGLFAICGFDISECKILDNYIDQGNIGNTDYNNGYGILAYDAQHALPGRNFVKNNLIRGNFVTTCYGTGIYCVVGIDNTIAHNIVVNSALTMDSSSLRQGGIVANESVRTIIDGNHAINIGGAQLNLVSGIASLVGTGDMVTNNTIDNVPTSGGDGFYCGGTGEVVTITVGGTVADNTITNCGQHGLHFDITPDKTGLIIEGNSVTSVAGVGMRCGQLIRCLIKGNSITDFGDGQQGFLSAGTGSGTNRCVFEGNIVVTTVSNSGRAFSFANARNQFINNVVIGAGILATGFYDTTNLSSEPNIYSGNRCIVGVTNPFSFLGQVSCLNGNYNTGAGAPVTTPFILGEDYYDSTNEVWYTSKGTSSAADWVAYVSAIAPTLTGQVIVQAAAASTLLQQWNDNAGNPIAAINNSGAVGVGTAQLGIGTANPLRPLHIMAADIGAGTYIALDNTDTTHNNNGSIIAWTTTTTGVGGAAFKGYASITGKILTHDQPTLASTLTYLTANGSGAFNTYLMDQFGAFTIPGNVYATVRDNGGADFDVKHPTYGCKCDAMSAIATGITLNSPTITMTVPTSGDVGTAISVPGAGTAGATLATTISAVNGTLITLASPIVTTVRTAIITYGASSLTAVATNVVAGSTLSVVVPTSADAGKTISIPGAGTAGAALVTTISTVSGTTITLAANCLATIASATALYGTDDTTHFRNAITAAAAVSGTVLVPTGNMLIASLITLPSNIAVMGTGPGSMITGTSGLEVLISLNGSTGVRIRNLTLNGGASVGIFATACSNFLIDNCVINNFNRVRDTLYTSGILLNAATIGWIQKCQFANNGYGGAGAITNGAIVFKDNPTTDCTFINVVFNEIVGAGLYGICGFDVSDCKFISNTINQGNVGTTDYNNGYGILVYDAQHASGRNYVFRNVVAFNNVSNCYGTGIYLVVGIDNIIAHNIVKSVALTMDSSSLRQGGIIANESVNTIIDANEVDTVGGAQVNQVAGIASLIGTNDEITNNRIANVTATAGDGINVGGSGEVVTSTVGGRYSGNSIKTVGRYGMNFDTSTAKVDLVVESNYVQSCGSIGYFINNVQYSQFNHNKVRDFGAGSQGFLIGSSSSTTNVSLNGCEAEITSTNSGRGFQIATGPNTVNSCVASGIGAALSVGFLDQSNTTPPVVWTGYSYTRGTVTTPFSRSGQQSCLDSMYNSGAGAPATTPRVVGEKYLDTTNKQFYIAVGTSAATDWAPSDTPLLTGTAAPATTPFRLNLMFLDTTNKKAYVSMGVASSADWVLLN